jgi:hypothetical protein
VPAFHPQRRQFGHDAIRTQNVQKVELLCAGVLSPFVRQVYDFALRWSVDRAVRLVDEALGMLCSQASRDGPDIM